MKKLKKINLKKSSILSKNEMTKVIGGNNYSDGCGGCDTTRPCMTEGGHLGRCTPWSSATIISHGNGNIYGQESNGCTCY